MKKLYTKIDHYILKNHPFNWIIGWHIFLPIIIILALIGVVSGFSTPTKIYSYSGDDGLGVAAFFVGFLALMGFILYIVRQIRYNSFRIHHHLPFKKSIYIFFSFWIIASLFSLLPFIPHQIYAFRIKQKTISKEVLDHDARILHRATVFFKSDQLSQDKIARIKQNPNLINDRDFSRNIGVVFLENSVILNNNSYTFGYDYKISYPKTITKTEALEHIQNFIDVAKKYGIVLSEIDPEKIYNLCKKYNETGTKYSFYVSPNNEESAESAYSYMIHNYQKYYDSIDTDVIIGIFIFSIIIAALLWVFISVPVADFGYSILVGVLLIIFAAVLSFVITLGTRDDFFIRLLLYFIIALIYVKAFLGRKTRLNQILKIVSHYTIPFLLFLFMIEIDKLIYIGSTNLFYVFGAMIFSGVITSVFIFKKVYKNYRILPQ